MMNNQERSVARRGVALLFGVFTLGILLGSFIGCKGPVEFVPPSEIWRNPLSPKPLPMEDVCGACNVDHQLLEAGGHDLFGCVLPLPERRSL